MKKLGSIISLPLALLLVVFFFLPWLELKCDAKDAMSSGPLSSISGGGSASKTLGTASGLNLTLGTMSLNKDLADMADKPDKDGKKPQESLNDTIAARPWFILGLLVPIAALIVGAAGMTGKMPASGKLLIVLAVVGLVVIILAATSVDYVKDMVAKERQEAVDKAKKEAGQAGITREVQDQLDKVAQKAEDEARKVYSTAATPWLWISLVLYVLLAGCGIMAVAPIGAVGKPAVPTPPA